MAKVRTRPDVGTLGTDAAPWHPTLLAYAQAVGAMQRLPLSDPRSWAYQAAIHGRNGAVPAGARWNECQHATWYFLPWHRMYLAQFEAIIQAVLVEQFNGPADWSLPFWNYEAAGANRLPPAFRTPRLPNGSPNPLYVTQRSGPVNQGSLFPSVVTSSARALNATTFTSGLQTTGFGGPRTSFAHQGPAFGALEAQPHGPIHVFINGWMGDPATAAQDPIFWLHHANIDRLWEQWNRKPGGGGPNETSSAWTGRTFRLFAPNRAPVTMRVQDVLDIEGKMGYTYAGLPAKARRAGIRASAAAEPGRAASASRGPRPELIGASGQVTSLSGETIRVGVPLTTPKPRKGRAADTPRRVMLDIGEITGDTNPSMVYGVYVNRPDTAAGDADDYLAGVVSTFGIVQASTDGGGGLRFTFDITELADRLADDDRWDPAHLDIDFEPISPEDSTAHPPITVGSVRVYVR